MRKVKAKKKVAKKSSTLNPKKGHASGVSCASDKAVAKAALSAAKAEAKLSYASLRKAITAHKASCLVMIRLMDGTAADKRELRDQLSTAISDVNAAITTRTKPTQLKIG